MCAARLRQVHTCRAILFDQSKCGRIEFEKTRKLFLVSPFFSLFLFIVSGGSAIHLARSEKESAEEQKQMCVGSPVGSEVVHTDERATENLVQFISTRM